MMFTLRWTVAGIALLLAACEKVPSAPETGVPSPSASAAAPTYLHGILLLTGDSVFLHSGSENVPLLNVRTDVAVGFGSKRVTAEGVWRGDRTFFVTRLYEDLKPVRPDSLLLRRG
ncbi:MAG: hypothetical protein ACHQU1_09760 [Gemmatimonadales bacterium]